MADPELLRALKEIGGDSDGEADDHGPPPTPQVNAAQRLQQLNTQIQQEKQKALKLKQEGKIDQAKQTLLSIRQLQTQADALQQAVASAPPPAPAPTPVSSARPSSTSTTKQPPPPTHDEDEDEDEGEVNLDDPDEGPNPAVQKALAEVNARINRYKQAALAARQAGNEDKARALVKDLRVLKAAAENLDIGLMVDLRKLPSDPTAPLPASSAPSSATASSRSSPSSSASATTSRAAPPSYVNEEEELRVQTWDLIEAELNKRVATLTQQALRANREGDKQTALVFLSKKRDVTKNLDAIKLVKSMPLLKLAPPPYHFEHTSETFEVTFPNLANHEMEVCGLGCHSLKPPAGFSALTCYVLVEVLYPGDPSPPQKVQTGVVPGLDPQYNHVQKVQIERKKSFQRFLEKKKSIIVYVYHSRFLLADLLVGKGELSLQPLLDKSELVARVPIMPEGVRKGSFGTVELRIRMHTPLVKKDIKKIEETILVLDAPIPLPSSAPEPAPAQQAKPKATTAPPARAASSSTTTTSSTSSTSPSPSSSAAAITSPSSSSSSSTSNSVPKPVSTTSLKPAPAQSPPPSSSSDDDDEGDPDQVDIISNDVLEFEVGRLNNLIAQYKTQKKEVPEEIEDRKQALELKMNILVIQVQTGALSVETYTDMLMKKIEEEKVLAQKLVQKGKRDWAKAALHRAKVMKQETEAGDE
eukprot:TRINITY_DN2227_c0_g1_i2.p1 TRINITY_DN2227_c0_g1~~TRINITY_DN2227_c0_g1_i2.p1  ORF type:complete len:785 (-),score=252.31 TRINITY_DN2227_c0_g1_i2:70-2169(-)